MLKIKTPAKINLVLEVLGKRPDGYHEIKSIMQSIGLYDELSFENADVIKFECDEYIHGDNLVTRAAAMLKNSYNYGRGANIKLKKNIPLSGGLGGGSSDAAATLIGLNHLWKLGLSKINLLELASKLGSDVPFFIHKGTALIEGRGEKISLLPCVKSYWAVLMIPAGDAMEKKTAAMYSRLVPEDFTDGRRVIKTVDKIINNGRLDMTLLFNAFDQAARDNLPEVEAGFTRFLEAGARHVHVAGSGPVLFTLVEDKHTAEKLVGSLRSVDREGKYLTCQFTDK